MPRNPDFLCKCRGGVNECSCHFYGTTWDCAHCGPYVMRKDGPTEKDARREKFEKHRSGNI